MEDNNAQQGARPKQSTDHVGEDPTGFGQFCLKVESFLTCSQAVTLATWFGYPPAKIDEIKRSDNPSRVFVQFMAERGEIGLSRTDISPFINALESEVVCLHGVAAKVKEACQQCLMEAPPSTVTNELKEKKIEFIEQLMTKYKNLCGATRPVPYLPKRFTVDKLYVESGAKFLESSHDIKAKWTPLESCRGILIDPRVKSKRRIVEGEPGIGKSTFALRIAHDWVNNHESMKDIEILILLRLRQYKNLSSVYSAIKRFLLPKESKLSEEDIEEILQTFKSSTMIILDGYDEYSDQGNQDTDINLIIKGDMFPDCWVILTSRMLPPECSSNTQRIKLTGFDDAARDAYIEKAVVCGDKQAAKPVKEFFEENSVSKYLCHIPLFFVMVAHMTHWHKLFKNIKKVAIFFEKIIACLHSHEQIRETGTGKLGENQQFSKSHSKLNEIAYEGLSGHYQQMTWNKDKLCSGLGQALYEDYVRIGILVEEEVFDWDSCVTKTEVSFCHKLFHEWFAAQYIAQEASRSDVQFEPWPDIESFRFFFHEGVWHVKRPQPVINQRYKMLKSLHPCFAQFMYQFACGLNSDAAVKIIEHLGKEAATQEYTLLCIKEWGGNLENILNTVTSLCSEGISITETLTVLHEESAIEVVQFASSRKIPILKLVVGECLDFSVLSKGILHFKRSNISVPVITTLEELQIFEVGVEITEKETASILQYSSMCSGLKVLMFFHCLLPRYIKETEATKSLRSRGATVLWIPAKYYILNFESGEWEETCSFSNWDERQIGEECKAAKAARASRGAPMSDKDYEGAKKVAWLYAENKKKSQRRL